MLVIYDIVSRQFLGTYEDLRRVRETQAGLGMEFLKNLAEVLA